MLRNYIVTSYRNLLRNKVYAALNIAGLALGIGCSLVIYKVINYETGFDKFRANYSEIYRLVGQSESASGIDYDAGVPFPTGKALRNDYPELTKIATVMSYEDVLITLDNEDKFQEGMGLAFTEPEFLEIFDFEILHGKRVDYLTSPEEALISESLAAKFFGYNGTNPDVVIGQSLTFDNALKQTISAIFEDQPEQTDFPFTLFIPYDSQQPLNPFYQDGTNWEMTMSNNHVYFTLAEGTNIRSLESTFGAFLEKYRSAEIAERNDFSLLPLSEEHFSQRYSNFTGRIAREEFLLALAIIGVFLIVTGAVNFINMATAQSVIRAKEIGIRKVMGGRRSQLVIQIFAETFIITFLALLISLGLAELFFIQLQDILGYRLYIDLLGGPGTIIFLLVILLTVTFLSGLYPALLLSKSSALLSMKTRGMTSKGSINVRRGLVIFQFAISQFLIFATLVINSQMDYFQNAPLGFEQDNILQFGLPDNNPQTLEVLRNQLLTNPKIEAVSFALGGPTSDNNATTAFSYPKSGSDDRHQANFKSVDEHYVDLFGLEILAGRNLRSTDDSVILINETMLAKMGLTDPSEAIGERVRAWGNRNIVGVIKDFHTYSLHEEKIPTVLFRLPPYYYQGQVKLSDGISYADVSQSIEYIGEKWSEAFPKYLYDYTFVDDFLATQYEAEQRVSKLYQIFSILAIFIGCLGLYGLISFIANQKTKEIGIRKVLGATLGNILNIFSKELVMLLLIAFVIATPLAYTMINDWLNEFSYQVKIGARVFGYSFGITLIIALVTMGYNSITAALANPVDSLRDE